MQRAILVILHTEVVNIIGEVICYILIFPITTEFP